MPVNEHLPHVLILSLVFPPDNVSTAQIMGELAEDLVSRGHEVTVLTTMPHYNPDPVAESRQPLTRVWGPFLSRSRLAGATVYHTLMLKKTPSRTKRVLAWGIFHLVSTVVGLRLGRRPDVILSASPPLTIGIAAWIIGRRFRIPVIYNVQELFPDVASKLGVIRSQWLLRILYNVENFVYDKVDRIIAISPGMAQQIQSKGVSAEKVACIPNWVELGTLRPLSKDNSFSRQHRLYDRFVVGYAGNVGLAQDFQDLLGAASALRYEDRIHFLIVGGGVAQASLRMTADQLGLGNVAFLPHQPYELVPQIYASIDLGVVTLDRKLINEALPSKVYRIMACGRPVLAIADSRSDLARMVRGSGCGVVVEPGKSQTLAAEIVAAFEDAPRLREMGRAGRQHVETHNARDDVVNRFSQEIREVVCTGYSDNS